jgi:hypothetical protein
MLCLAIREAFVSRSSAVSAWLPFVGAALFIVTGFAWLGHSLDAPELARAYQFGFASSAVTLGSSNAGQTTSKEQAVLSRRLERARIVSAYDPERLRAVPPFVLFNDGRFWPYAGDVMPNAAMRLRWDGAESGELSITPYDGGEAWSVLLRSKRLVRPDWSPFSNLVAYYSDGRVWIVDVKGKRFQSLVQEPLLEEGGVLRFSADGTALAFYFNADQRWKAQDLYVLAP